MIKGNAMFISDGQGNQMRIVKEKMDKMAASRVYLKLNSEHRERYLGLINPVAKTIYVKRNREVHLLRKLNAYGFNYALLTLVQDIDFIEVSDETGVCLYRIKDILEHGTFLNFKQQGFELQIFYNETNNHSPIPEAQ